MEKRDLNNEEIRKRASNLLTSLIRRTPKKTKRLTDLLIEFEDAKFSKGWYFCVPRAFRDSLDIKLTDRVIKKQKVKMWTQGTTFCFNVGEILYDTALGYEGWSEALKHLKIMVQIKSASAAVPGKERFSGQLKMEIWAPNKNKTGIDKLGEKDMSQDDFIRLLIAGPSKTWGNFILAEQA